MTFLDLLSFSKQSNLLFCIISCTLPATQLKPDMARRLSSLLLFALALLIASVADAAVVEHTFNVIEPLKLVVVHICMRFCPSLLMHVLCPGTMFV
jgi:hypothetical protein